MPSQRLSLPPPARIAIGFAEVAGKRVELFVDPEWARYFNSLNTQVQTVSDAVNLLGAASVGGGISLIDVGGDGDGFIPVVGPRGLEGPAGPVLGLLADAVESETFVPGLKGDTGLQGPAGPAVGLVWSEDTSDQPMIDPPLTLRGDVTGTSSGGSVTATISAAAVTLAKMANLAANSIVGNNTGSPATPLALTAAQVKTLLAIANTDVSGLGTMSTQNANGVAITGGTVNGATVGATTPAAGTFTTLGCSGALSVGGAAVAANIAGEVTVANGQHAQVNATINAVNTIGFLANGTGGAVAGIPAGSVGLRSVAGSITVAPAGTAVATISTSLFTSTVPITANSGTAIPAGGTAGAGLKVSSATNFGVFFGSGAPTLSAAKGSIYLRSDGSSTSTRMYVNTDGGTTWTNFTTAA